MGSAMFCIWHPLDVILSSCQVDNAKITMGNTTVTYTCPGGGEAMLTCRAGAWSGSIPVCYNIINNNTQHYNNIEKLDTITQEIKTKDYKTVKKSENQKIFEKEEEEDDNKDIPGRAVHLAGHYCYTHFVSIFVFLSEYRKF